MDRKCGGISRPTVMQPTLRLNPTGTIERVQEGAALYLELTAQYTWGFQDLKDP